MKTLALVAVVILIGLAVIALAWALGPRQPPFMPGVPV